MNHLLEIKNLSYAYHTLQGETSLENLWQSLVPAAVVNPHFFP